MPESMSVADAVGGRDVVRRCASPHNQVLVLRGPTVLKLYSTVDRFDNELATLTTLAHARVPAPEVLRVGEIEDDRYRRMIEMSFVDGHEGRPAALGDYLAALAAVTNDRAGSVVDVARGGGTSWPAYLRGKLDSYAATVAPLDSARVRRTISSVADGLAALEPAPTALLHADISRPNVRRQRDGSVILIDWELGRWGDPLFDVAVLIHRGLLDDHTTDPAARDRLRTYRALLSLRDLALVERVPHESLAATARAVRQRFGL